MLDRYTINNNRPYFLPLKRIRTLAASVVQLWLITQPNAKVPCLHCSRETIHLGSSIRNNKLGITFIQQTDDRIGISNVFRLESEAHRPVGEKNLVTRERAVVEGWWKYYVKLPWHRFHILMAFHPTNWRSLTTRCSDLCQSDYMDEITSKITSSVELERHHDQACTKPSADKKSSSGKVPCVHEMDAGYDRTIKKKKIPGMM